MNTASLQGSPSHYERLRSSTWSFFFRHYRGIALCLTITWFSILLSKYPAFASMGVNPILLAMAAGIVIGNLFPQRHLSSCESGITFSKQRLLRLGIILFGFRLTFADLSMVGLGGIVIDACVLISTMAIALIVGKGIFRLETSACLVIGAGSAICGAAAILATEPVVKAKPEEVSVAVACVVLFGTCATLLYPFLYHLNLDWHILPATHHAFGLYIGSTIHEVAQVAATARLIDAGVADTAVIEKMARVMMLPLFLMTLPLICTKADSSCMPTSERKGTSLSCLLAAGKNAIPWFAVWFCIAIAANSLITISAGLKERLLDSSLLFLTMAMAALGMGTRLSAFNRSCYKLVVLAGILFLWLVVGGVAINHFIPRFLA